MRFLRPLIFFAGLLLASFAYAYTPGEPMLLPVDQVQLEFETASGQVRFDVEIADTNEERARGLMHRVDFPDDRAMLFIFDQTRDVMMWMQNTPTALDMVFISENGVVSAIAPDTKPLSEAIVSSQGPVRFVVELKAGTASKRGIEIGNRLVHPVISKVLGQQ
ncbi:MAG: DUF192 domain-containing protein [Phyllobacterium sp.]